VIIFVSVIILAINSKEKRQVMSLADETSYDLL
jgi:hypothetical protein